MRRALVTADTIGIAIAFAMSTVAFGPDAGDRIQPSGEVFLFLLTLPMWLVLAKLQGLYERDEERADHSTADEIARRPQPRHARNLALPVAAPG